MCDYCKNDGQKAIAFCGKLVGFRAFIFPPEEGGRPTIEGSFFINDCYVEDDAKIEINYCPMCGRKLSE